MTNVILFGPPGAGKGTQSKKLLKKYGLFHISTGDLFRAHIAEQTPIGKRIKETVESGALVSDRMVISVLDDAIACHQNTFSGFLFDGFPRTPAQAGALDRLLEEKKTTIHHAILLNVPETELKKRILKRKTIEGRSDDDQEKLEQRIRLFFDQTTRAFPFYKDQGKFATVNGMGDVDSVFAELCSLIEKIKA